MRPSVWAPAMWRTMHAVALAYPDRPADDDHYRKAAYRTFFVALGDVIPCAACAASYRRLILAESRSLDVALDRGTLFDWTVTVHNRINAEIGKPTMSIRQAKESILSSPKSMGQDPLRQDPLRQDPYPPTLHPMMVGVVSFVGFLVAFFVAFVVWKTTQLLHTTRIRTHRMGC